MSVTRVSVSNPVRAFFAWLFACLTMTAALVGTAAASALFAEVSTTSSMSDILFVLCLVFLVIAAVSALPVLTLVYLARAMRLPRGWTDTLFAAGLVIVAHRLMWELAPDVSPVMSEDQYPLIAAFFAIAGAVGGLTYWFAAGRPRPPY